ncbi:putative ribonuclease H-like domain-containing protein [Tanacetum coccineum]
MDLETAQTTITAKLSILKQGEYDMWRLRIKQYFQVQDCALWDVIENGNSFKLVAQTTTNVVGTSTSLIHACNTEKRMLKTLFAVIQIRFGGNDETKKTQKTLLKQMYENFSAPSTESLVLFLTAQRLSASEVEYSCCGWGKNLTRHMCFDDLYKTISKIIKKWLKGTAKLMLKSSSFRNMAFVSSLSSTNEVNTAYGVSTANTQISPASTQVSIASTQKTGRKITINGSDTAGYDKSKVESFNYHKIGHFARECKGPRNQDSRNRNQDSSKRTINVEETSSKAMMAIDGAGFDWSYMADDEVPANIALLCLFRLSDLSYSGLEEFQQPEFEGYGPKTSKSVSENISNKVKESPDALLVEELVLDDKLEKKTADCNYHQRERVVSGNNYTRVNYNYSAKKAHPSAHRNMVPRAVLMKTGLRSLNTARPVNTAHPKTTVYSARPMPKAVNTARPNSAVVNAVRENQVNAVKASACWVWRPTKLNSASITLKRHNYGHLQKEDQGYVDSGCSRHMTWNMSYLSDFKEFDEGYVTFGGRAKGGKITSKGTLKTADESQVLLKVPRKNNMYIVDIKNIVSKESLTCLVAKATLDELMLWHRRQVHVNFKTINKLVKENLVRGLPTKRFENDQTCVAYLKRKQHKASCKSKIQNFITQPLFMLHMDLFGPTFVSSLINKKYCLVVTDDNSIFTWVFFLATKDETSGILKSFITELENLVDKKLRRNCVARTSQQIGVAERRNRTLIEAARTMLADSKLPTTFWAEAVNTSCYVQNRVLVVKPHNKTPYELFRGRTPALSFMRPFGCHVTILNTLDYLGKFDGKSDEGFFVGYLMNSKAFRVYNIRTRKVEENLHIRFLKDKPIIAGDGPKWLFDIDVLTKSMNYVPVVAGTNYNDYVGGIDDQEKPEDSAQDVNTTGLSINTASTNINTGSLNINTVSPIVPTAPLESTYADFFGAET